MLDHLYLDQDAVPTFVEVKRSSDTRIRREVVGQMLDYAANAASYWNVDALRAWFTARCEDLGVGPDDAVREAFPSVEDTGAYWEKVGTNLTVRRAGTPRATTATARRDPDVDLPPDAVERRPRIPLAALVEDDTRNQVLAVFD
jgi:hypothetical protein